MYVGNRGLKIRTPSPGSSNASAKYCSNGFAPEPTTTFSAVASMPNSCWTNRAAPSRNSGKPRLGPYPVRFSSMARMPAALACGGEGNGLSPISSSTTSLPAALSWRARASTVKAVSALRFRARALSLGMVPGFRQGDGRSQVQYQSVPWKPSW